MKPVKQVEVKDRMTAGELVKEFGESGVFQAGNLAKAAGIYEEMLNKKAKVVLSLAGAMVPGGMRKIVADLIRDGMIDLLVSTGANITHDLASAFGEEYYACSPDADDAAMREKGVSRIYDVASPDEASIGFEKGIQEIFSKIPEGKYSPPELVWKIGEQITDEDSIARQAFLKKVPVYIPAFTDSLLGFQLWLHNQDRKVEIDPIKELQQVHDWMYENKERGVIVIGGGVPKNYALQAALIPGPHKYVIQVTTDVPQWGGLSGATPNEGVSWGKVDPKAKTVVVYSDATIVFPLIVAAVRERLSSRA